MKVFTISFLILGVILLAYSTFYYLMNKRAINKKPYNKILIASFVIAFISLIILAVSFDYVYNIYANPLLFDKDFSKIGSYGDFFGGILNPIFAIIGIFAASLAFYAQYDANNQIKEQFKIQQFESQFYTMLNLHKENVESLYLILLIKDKDDNVIENYVKGRIVFEKLLLELHVILIVALKKFPKETPKAILNQAYNIFFNGFNYGDLNKHPFFKEIDDLEKILEDLDYDTFKKQIMEGVNLDRDFVAKIEYPYFKGHVHQLAHYYRHLFQTVKFIANQDESFISYNQKRNYLRILRSQLSNSEQVLLFYNWYSGFGKQWENDRNKFFTNYRMIHNIHQGLISSIIQLDIIFNLKDGYRKEVGRDSDNLFEFQDWV